MIHQHLPETFSTQQYLKDHFTDLTQNILISTDFQNAGHGRRGTGWEHFPDALAFSFTIKPSETMTLTPLEIGCLLAEFFAPKVTLKWPNDLLSAKREKTGGIICQLLGKEIVVGVGLNLFIKEGEANHFPYPVSGVFEEKPELKENFKKELPLKVYEYILSHRLSDKEIQQSFSKHCAHINQNVVIIDKENSFEGIFKGITSFGEAILEKDGTLTKVLTGSLRYR